MNSFFKINYLLRYNLVSAILGLKLHSVLLQNIVMASPYVQCRTCLRSWMVQGGSIPEPAYLEVLPFYNICFAHYNLSCKLSENEYTLVDQLTAVHIKPQPVSDICNSYSSLDKTQCIRFQALFCDCMNIRFLCTISLLRPLNSDD